MGYEKARDDIMAVFEAVKPVLQANEEDDMLDEDGDGQCDVDQRNGPAVELGTSATRSPVPD